MRRVRAAHGALQEETQGGTDAGEDAAGAPSSAYSRSRFPVSDSEWDTSDALHLQAGVLASVSHPRPASSFPHFRST